MVLILKKKLARTKNILKWNSIHYIMEQQMITKCITYDEAS